MAGRASGRRGAGLGSGFRAQLASTGLANLADGVFGTLAPLAALTLTSSPAQVSLLTAAGWVPWLVLGLAAGVVIDRTDRRRVQVLALGVRAAVLAAAAVLSLTGRLSMPALLAIALIYGVTEVFADLGATAIVPDLVPADRLPAANGRLLGVQQVANTFLGSPLAGALIVVGAGAGFGTSAALAALAALTLAVGLRGRFRPTPRTTSHPLAEVREGLAFVVRHPVIRPLVIAAGLINLANTGYFAVFVLWAVGPDSAMGLTPALFPLLTLGLAVGAVAGSLLTDRLQRRFGELRTMIAALTAGELLMLVPVLWPNGWAVAVAFALVGLTGTTGNVLTQSLRQRLVPRGLLGRVGGAGRTLSYGLMPIGAVLGGLIAERFGLATTFYAAVVVGLAACGLLALALPNVVIQPADAPAAESATV
ncbi:MAG: MFS transporter [Micropruina sp.]|uniref:MFS transporter n=1 Tax=Micropruina sp. TaxID=2737536 RepID=UPI0039E26605